ncbi:MAG: MotA/TolQ/ExbB proton channel family protein [Verrucomicrobia bacterium]|jgi:biopolymer transport protein ExbB|nr:MAG: MotA/TolQ/ExbB proton channel family protein [Verrucomicrobiota bacterium]
MLELLQKGGPLMWIILLCSVVALGVFLERLIYLHRASILVGELLGGLSLLIRNGRIAEALGECSSISGPVARVLLSALMRPKELRDVLQSITRDSALLEIPKLEKNLSILSALAYVTPLVGLLGMVLGLLDAFLAVSAHGGYATAEELSRGVYESMLNAAAGLAVAIPAFIGHSYLTARVNDIIHDMERAGIEIVNLLTSPPSEGDQPAA